MNEQFMASLSPTEKAEFLKSNATNIKEGIYFKRYTQQEIEEKKDQLVDACIEVDHKEIEFADVKATYNESIKHSKALRTALTTCIQQRGESANGHIYEFADQDSGYMVSFDIQGMEIDRRKLRPEERQINIFQLNTKQA